MASGIVARREFRRGDGLSSPTENFVFAQARKGVQNMLELFCGYLVLHLLTLRCLGHDRSICITQQRSPQFVKLFSNANQARRTSGNGLAMVQYQKDVSERKAQLIEYTSLPGCARIHGEC
jgi:hypothetical protein